VTLLGHLRSATLDDLKYAANVRGMFLFGDLPPVCLIPVDGDKNLGSRVITANSPPDSIILTVFHMHTYVSKGLRIGRCDSADGGSAPGLRGRTDSAAPRWRRS
jgi:hypothetical protein